MNVLTCETTSKPYLSAFLSQGFRPVHSGSAPIYFPATRNASKLLMERIALHCHDYYMRVPSVEQLCLKERLWISLVNAYGRDTAMTIMPETYVLGAKRDLIRLTQKINQNLPLKMIAKGIEHNRKSLRVLELPDLQKLRRSDGYVIVQELIECSDLLEGEIFNFRIYGLINFFNGELSSVIARAGKIIYSESKDNPITSNSVVINDRLPRYTSELFAKNTDLDEDVFWKGVCSQWQKMTASIADKVHACGYQRHERFSQLVGLDIILDKQNSPIVLECNGRAQLRPTDPADAALKSSVFHDWVDSYLLENSDPQLQWQEC